MLRIDRDAIVWSAEPAERQGRPLLVMMHGRGANASDLAPLAQQLPHELVTASLRAPLSAPPWSWFESVEDGGPVDRAALGVLEWLDALEPVPWLGLLGFSQGGAMALQLLRHDPTRFACAVQLSGFIASVHDPRDVRVRSHRPAVFSGHGALDDVIPPFAARLTSEWLHENTDVEEHRYPDLAHWVSEEEVRDVSAFLQRRLDCAP